MSRRVRWIRDNIEKGSLRDSSLIVDAGDFLFPGGLPDDRAKKVASFIMDCYKKMGYEAIAVGTRDLAAGLDFLEKEASRKGLILLSVNILKDGNPVFQPYIILKKHGVKIGVIGLTAAHIPASAVSQVGQIEDPIESVKDALAYLQGKTDINILLSNAGHNVDVKILKNIPAINVIVGAGIGSAFARPVMVNKGFVLRATPKGKTIGRAEIVLSDNGSNPLKVKGRLITLGKAFAKDPEIAKRANALQAGHKRNSPKTMKTIFGGGSLKQGAGSTGHPPASNPFIEAIKRSLMQKAHSENSTKK